MSTGKVEIVLGAVQIKCEGSETFLENELPKLLDAVADFHNKTHEKIVTDTAEEQARLATGEDVGSKAGASILGEMGMNTVCQKLGGKSTRQVILAAAARLKFVKGKQTFSRADILEQMKKSTDYYDKNMRSNLTKTIRGMVKADILKEIKTDTYSIAAAESEKVRAKLV